MRYDESEKRIVIGVKEFVTAARLQFPHYLPQSEEDLTFEYAFPPEETVEKIPHVAFRLGEWDFVLVSERKFADPYKIEIEYITAEKRAKPSAEAESEARGEGYIYAFVAREAAGVDEGADCEIAITYRSEIGEEVRSERCDGRRLSKFFEKCISRLHEALLPEIERVTLRLPSMRGAKFPYSDIREGQRDFIRAAYKTLAKGGSLFAAAPTGTGKTVSALFPAIRALGEGRVKKVFYLTPKGTTAAAAKECLDLMNEGGVKCRSIILSAKEKLCRRGSLCKMGEGLCPAGGKRETEGAALTLFGLGYTTVTARELWQVAEERGVCPHELSLCYAELCDVIICDFNHLFDPHAYIRRFFGKNGDFAFLIDEAHNLPERAREMYSAAIGEEELLLFSENPVFGEFSQLRELATTLAEKLRSILFPYIKDELREGRDGRLSGAYHTKNLPEGLYDLALLGSDAIEKQIFKNRTATDGEAGLRMRILKDLKIKLDSFAEALANFDDFCELFLFLEGDFLRAEVFYLDTGRLIKEKTDLGRASVFFSGTLAPMDYYKRMLGADGASVTLSVDSPFAPEQLSVNIMDNIATTFAKRGETLLEVCRAIAATLSAKRGSYMIFAPSFDYAEKLYGVFSAKYPKIKSILQKPNMSEVERREFLESFTGSADTYLAAFCVTGGIYSEGIDLTGNRLIGAVIVGTGMPAPSYEREAIRAYFDEISDCGRLYAYIYPGFNKVLQAAGRVIRSDEDRGIIVLIDDRLKDPLYKKAAPTLWRNIRYPRTPKELNEGLKEFWDS